MKDEMVLRVERSDAGLRAILALAVMVAIAGATLWIGDVAELWPPLTDANEAGVGIAAAASSLLFTLHVYAARRVSTTFRPTEIDVQGPYLRRKYPVQEPAQVSTYRYWVGGDGIWQHCLSLDTADGRPMFFAQRKSSLPGDLASHLAEYYAVPIKDLGRLRAYERLSRRRRRVRR